jgi:hypothetical protein
MNRTSPTSILSKKRAKLPCQILARGRKIGKLSIKKHSQTVPPLHIHVKVETCLKEYLNALAVINASKYVACMHNIALVMLTKGILHTFV